MRQVATILLLCVAAVACDAFTDAAYVGHDASVAARVSLSPTVGDDAPEPTPSPPTETPTAVTTSATATVEVQDEASGAVIDGLCPAEVEPVRVGSTDDRAKWGNEWELFGTAREDGIVLEWDEPSVPEVTGYAVTRHSRDLNGDFVQGSVRTFAVDGLSSGRYVDATDLEPRARYRYRVFPVTADGLGFPTAPLEIWSLPAERPAAPIRATANYGSDTWYLRAYYAFLSPVSGMRVLRRESGREDWQIVNDELTVPDGYGSFFLGFWHEFWSDQDIDPTTNYEYAVCLGNAAGIGRATLIDASRDGPPVETKFVQVGPPQDIHAIAFPYYLSVYWLPVNDASVSGYRVECQPSDPGRTRNLRLRTWHRMKNYVTINLSFPDACRTKFRVRAVTVEGEGAWSEWTEVDDNDIVQPQADPSRPEVVSVTATHSRVHMIWRTDDSLDGLEVRYLRRQVGVEEEFRAYYGCFDWESLEEFDWEYSCSGSSAGFTDEYDVRPDTEYQYAVQAKRGDVIGPMSDPVSVRTTANPSTVERRPLPVYEFEGEPTSEGFRLSWELPDDPTLKGMLVEPSTAEYDLVKASRPIVLPPDQTDLLVLKRGYGPEPRRYVYDIKTFNDYGTQAVGFQRVYASAPGMLHCRATTEEVVRDDVGHHLTIRFRGCEEARTEIVRHELTADGFEVSEIDQPCAWVASEPQIRRGFDYFEGTLKCEYVDTSVKPGTWYIYELTQTMADGREFTSTHEIVTRPIYDAP